MAVNSMAGHIIGLGDRHPANILLDTRTADAVHIDLGIAFEQVRVRGWGVGAVR
jgi:ataxia telangiectasia mutated family protein